MFFVTFTLLLFDSGVCLSFNNGNTLNLRNHKSNREKSKLSVNKFQVFFLKKIIKTYIRVITTIMNLNKVNDARKNGNYI